MKVGDRVLTANDAPTSVALRAQHGTIVRMGDYNGTPAAWVKLDNGPRSANTDGSWRFAQKRLTVVEEDPSQEEIDRLFGIKKDEELQAEAQQLIGISHATILRMEARVLRLEAGSDPDWEVVAEAQNEVKLARAAALELEADYIERWGTQAHRKAFN